MTPQACSDLERLEMILSRHPVAETSLLAVLQDVQREYGFLPCEVLERIALALKVPLSRVFSVSTFYRAFSSVPQGRVVIRVCTGTACHIRGASLLLDELESELGVSQGQTTLDRRFTIKTVGCVGACAMAPVLIVGAGVHGNARTTKVPQYLQEATS